MIAALMVAALSVHGASVTDAVLDEHTHSQSSTGEAAPVNTKEIIFEHIRDAYWWHITTINEHEIAVYLPVIVWSKDKGLNVFSSKRLEHGHSYNGFSISENEKYKGKIVEKSATGEERRPIDLSLTKTAFSLLINSAIMLIIFLTVARSYRRRPKNTVPGGFASLVEMFVMSVEEDIVRKCAGKNYARFSPYLLTAFFFIFINNIIGLIPIFPGGANVTGNIAVTLVLSLFTMAAVNLFGTRTYWKEIFWPEVPVWLKAPLPLMPLIELFGVISKPFALTIRLFANITAGHALALSLACVIFITARMNPAAHAGMTAFSVILAVFMSLLELLVAYLQAYVFTMLSAVFIGLAQEEGHHKQ